jgi:hypothetical protein
VTPVTVFGLWLIVYLHIERKIKMWFMALNISWNLYLAVMTVGLIAWYLFVAMAYYRNEIKLLVTGRFAGNSKTQKNQQVLTKETNSSHSLLGSSPGVASIHVGMNDLIERIQMITKTAADKSFNREEILLAIKLGLKQYQPLKQTPFFQAVNNLIINECGQTCGIELEQEELNGLWND